METFKVALVQAASVVFERKATIEKSEEPS